MEKTSLFSFVFLILVHALEMYGWHIIEHWYARFGGVETIYWCSIFMKAVICFTRQNRIHVIWITIIFVPFMWCPCVVRRCFPPKKRWSSILFTYLAATNNVICNYHLNISMILHWWNLVGVHFGMKVLKMYNFNKLELTEKIVLIQHIPSNPISFVQ